MLTLPDLFHVLDRQGLPFVVIRNWRGLPFEVQAGPHRDLDLLVERSSKGPLLKLWGATRVSEDPAVPRFRVPVLPGKSGKPASFLANLRTVDDNYFPRDLAAAMLDNRCRQDVFYVPPALEYVLGLVYHAVHHLGVMTWESREEILNQASAAGLGLAPSRLFDFGYLLTLLEERGLSRVPPEDPSISPLMPFVHPLETVISSRKCTEHLGKQYQSRVYKLQAGQGSVIRKQTTCDLADRELSFLSQLNSPYFPKALGRQEGPDSTVIDIEFVDGHSLDSPEGLAAVTASIGGAKAFFHGCLNLLEVLQQNGITHRDVRDDNILVRDELPVLLDFGWAISDDRQCFAPEGMNGHYSPPDHFCDVYSMGFALRRLVVHFPEFAHVVRAMTRAAREDRTTNVSALREMLNQETPYRPFLSIIMRVAGDNTGALQRCLEALVANTPESLFEVVFVKWNATDEMTSFLRLLEGDVRIVSVDGEADLAEAYSGGAEAASGRYLVFLDQFAEVGPGWLEAVRKLAEIPGEPDPNWRLLDLKGGNPPQRIQHSDVGSIILHRADRAIMVQADLFRIFGGPEALRQGGGTGGKL